MDGSSQQRCESLLYKLNTVIWHEARGYYSTKTEQPLHLDWMNDKTLKEINEGTVFEMEQSFYSQARLT